MYGVTDSFPRTVRSARVTRSGSRVPACAFLGSGRRRPFHHWHLCAVVKNLTVRLEYRNDYPS
jgi:hypothetical protein